MQSSRAVIAEALSQLAALRVREGNHAEAAGLYKSALATQPSPALQLDLAEELTASGDAANGKALASDVAAADPGDARAVALSEGRAAPGTAKAPIRAAQALASEGQLRRVLALTYSDWGGAVVRAQGDYAGALLLFDAATHWDPTAPGAMKNKALAAFRLGEYGQSASSFRSVLDATPGDTQARLLLGLSLFSLQQFKEASAAFAQAPQVAIADSHAAYAWAFSLAHTAEPLQANKIIDTLTTRHLPAEELVLACQVYEQTENYEHAVSCLNQAAAMDASLRKVHESIGISLIHLSRPADAIPELRKELALEPNDADGQFYLAYALIQTSQNEEAQSLLATVVEQQPGNGEAQYQLGKLLAAQSHWPQAIVHLEEAAKTEPANYDIHYQLQNAYRRNGQSEDAARELAIYKSIKDTARAR